MPSIPILFSCPNCGFTYRDLKGFSSVDVTQCKRCGQVMCAACCNSSFWSGYICPKCGSKEKDLQRIGRIKDPIGMPTFWESIEDDQTYKSELSPVCLKFLAVAGILGGWLIGFPFEFNVIATIAGVVVFLGANKISKRGSG